MKRYIGKVVLITGASRGIGRAVAKAFAEEEAWVALGARDHTLRHAGRELSADHAVEHLHQTCPQCRPRPAATVKSP